MNNEHDSISEISDNAHQNSPFGEPQENVEEDDFLENPPAAQQDEAVLNPSAADVVVQENLEIPGPRKCMVYESFDSLFNAYQEFARISGFSAVKRTNRQNKYYLIACDKSRVSSTQIKSKRVGCPARINSIKQFDGSQRVSTTVTHHNHNLHPSMSILMAGHRNLSVHMRRQLEANDTAGIRPNKNIRMLEVQCGGPENMGCLPKDCRNHIDSMRRFRLGDGDAEAIRVLFTRLQHQDPNFFHLIDLDDEGRLKNVLWIHPRSRAAYEEFHDVVSFDTTYCVNRYDMPFGVFVGVNHHGQSILLGCDLLTSEDAGSFKWLFENWIKAMDGVHPKAIITDQCESINIALREVMPTTTHRFCLWHIMSKLPVKFKGVADYNKASSDFKAIVYDSVTITFFERKWADFLREHGLQNKVWLKQLFDVKEKWVPVYMNKQFWAGMRSTQRSEGMHAYFDDFLHSRISLKQFMEQYEVAIGKKIQKEFIADFDSKNKVIRLKTHFVWEKEFREAYTNSIFLLLQEQMDETVYSTFLPAPEDDVVEVGVEKYRVLDRCIRNNFYHTELTYKVEYRPVGEFISCECSMFESKGILCRHRLKVMNEHNIHSVHDRYFLRRWRKDVFRRHSVICFKGGYPHMTDEYKKFQEVEKYFQQCMDVALGSVDLLEFVKTRLVDLKTEVLSLVVETDEPEEGEAQRLSPGGTPIGDPDVRRRRGRPGRVTRMMSAAEIAIREAAERERAVRERASRATGRTGRPGTEGSQGRAGTGGRQGRAGNSRGRAARGNRRQGQTSQTPSTLNIDLNEPLPVTQESMV